MIPLNRTGNKRWFVTEKSRRVLPGSTSSERASLIALIKQAPGVTTERLQEQTVEPFTQRVPSRLAELEGDGYVYSKFDVDLFSR